MTDELLDLLIIGGGPGGLTSAIYASRGELKTVMVEKTGIGGQISLADVIENYPGMEPMSGAELMAKFEEHAKRFGLVSESAEVTSIEDAGEYRRVTTSGGEYKAKTVVIASGAKPRRLMVPGEAEFTGRGVSYCATCDGFFFRQKEVAVIGGGDTAVKESLFLSNIVNKIHHFHRRDELRAEKLYQDRLLANPKIEVHWNTVIDEVVGNTSVTGVKARNVKTDQVETVPVSGVFVLIGGVPNSEFFSGDKTDLGYIKTDDMMATSMPGVFAAGDVRDKHLRQVATAVGDGAMAAYAAQDFIDSQPPRT